MDSQQTLLYDHLIIFWNKHYPPYRSLVRQALPNNISKVSLELDYCCIADRYIVEYMPYKWYNVLKRMCVLPKDGI